MRKDTEKQRHLEADIKALVLNQLRKSGRLSQDTCVINEFTMGQISGRLDIALITKGRLLAFEIKSEADSLHRLKNQLSTYQNHFDKVTIVADTKHIEKILETVPSKVAVWEVAQNRIHVKQRGRISQINKKTALLHLLTINELKKSCLEFTNFAGTSSRKNLVSVLTGIPMSTVRYAVLSHLRARFSQTTNRLWATIGTRDITPGDIVLLSPYHDQRHREIENQKNNQVMLKKLGQFDCDDPQLLELAQSKKRNLFGSIPPKVKGLISD